MSSYPPNAVNYPGDIFTFPSFPEDLYPEFTTYYSFLPQQIAEINGSRSENYSTTEFTSKVEYACKWDDRYIYADYLMGRCYNHTINDLRIDADSYGERAAGNHRRNYYNDYFPAMPTAVQVSTFGAEGVSVTSAVNLTPSFQKYTMAKISVDYKGLARPGLLSLQQTTTPTFGMRQLPSWGYYWRSDGSPVLDAEAPAVQEPQAKIQRNLSGIRNIPWWFFSLSGCTNINAWSDLVTGISYLPGTLLFQASNMERSITMARGDDDYLWNISFEIAWNPIGWNNFRRPHGVDSMMCKNSAVYLYPPVLYPTLLVDPNNPDDSQFISDAYNVCLQRDDGSLYMIHVNKYGVVTDLWPTP